MNAGAIVIARQNRYIRVFENATAISYDRAVTLDELGLRDSRVFQRLVQHGVLEHAGDDRYFLNRHLAEDFRGKRRRNVVVAVAATLLALLLGFLMQ